MSTFPSKFGLASSKRRVKLDVGLVLAFPMQDLQCQYMVLKPGAFGYLPAGALVFLCPIGTEKVTVVYWPLLDAGLCNSAKPELMKMWHMLQMSRPKVKPWSSLAASYDAFAQTCGFVA